MGYGYIAVAVVIPVFIFSYWCYWCHWTNRRLDDAYKLQRQIIGYVFHNNHRRKEKQIWYDTLPLYSDMVPLGLFAPLTAKSLPQMVTGEFEEDFWRWKNQQETGHAYERVEGTT